MKKIILLILIGAVAGALDLIPLIPANVPLFNMLAVVVFWLVAVWFIDKARFFQNRILNGLVVSIALMIPLALTVSATNPKDFLPMLFMAVVLGPLSGLLMEWWIKESKPESLQKEK